MKKNSPNIFLVCTGLGRVQRGFESYTHDLAQKIHGSECTDIKVLVFSGGRLKDTRYNNVAIPNVSRNSVWLRRLKISSDNAFGLEQASFFIFFLPYLFWKKPKAIYLGEYSLYCYLFKARRFFKLNFSLILYTGGQTIPGLFDPNLDFVHHITDIYYKGLIEKGYPRERQFIIPHFLNTDFHVDENVVRLLKVKASGKKIIISVGSIDKTVKRMHLIPTVLGDQAGSIFPILLGEWTNESEEVRQLMVERFGADGFIIDIVTRNELGSYYTAADVFLLCSKKESFGLVFLEAMFFGLPVLCHDFYEARFVLKQHGRFINMDETSSFHQELRDLLPSLGKNDEFHSFVVENYTWPHLKESYLNMFETFLK